MSGCCGRTTLIQVGGGDAGDVNPADLVSSESGANPLGADGKLCLPDVLKYDGTNACNHRFLDTKTDAVVFSFPKRDEDQAYSGRQRVTGPVYNEAALADLAANGPDTTAVDLSTTVTNPSACRDMIVKFSIRYGNTNFRLFGSETAGTHVQVRHTNTGPAAIGSPAFEFEADGKEALTILKVPPGGENFTFRLAPGASATIETNATTEVFEYLPHPFNNQNVALFNYEHDWLGVLV